ncbi:hypothetical protein PHYPO_G00041910, partial [Pangasianodon hypophthalmus]
AFGIHTHILHNYSVLTDLRLPIQCDLPACFWEVGGNWRTQRKPRQTRGGHVKLHTDSNLSSVPNWGHWRCQSFQHGGEELRHPPGQQVAVLHHKAGFPVSMKTTKKKKSKKKSSLPGCQDNADDPRCYVS